MHIHNHIQHGSKMEIHELVPQLILTLPFIMALVIYLYAVILTKRGKNHGGFSEWSCGSEDCPVP